MKTFYKINTDATASIGSGTVIPSSFTEYTKGSEPKELLDALFLMSKPAKLQELETAYSNANFLDIDYMSTTFQADKKSQYLITGILAGGAVPSGFTWRDNTKPTNADVAMTFAEFQGLSQAIVARGQVNWAKYQDLKAQVALATTKADLDLIVW